jgi:hypothetical protein
MAVPAKTAEMEVLDEFDHVQLTAARLMAQGKSRSQVARTLRPHLLTSYQLRNPSMAKQQMLAMRKVRRWQRTKAFRDLVWQFSVERLDSRTPSILDGVASRAEAGRVDAAKLSLEIAGRYSPKGHDQPTAVQIVVNGVPRPMAIDDSAVVEGEIVSETDEL